MWFIIIIYVGVQSLRGQEEVVGGPKTVYFGGPSDAWSIFNPRLPLNSPEPNAFGAG